jgi:hypothetical protein
LSKKEESIRSWAASQAIDTLQDERLPTGNVSASLSEKENRNQSLEEEFELHLIRLGFQYCNLSSNYRLALLLGEEFLFHQKAIHPSLSDTLAKTGMALCAKGIFYSQHPSSCTLYDIGSESSKIEIILRFLTQAENMLPKEYSNELEVIDTIRALLIMIDVYIAIGQADHGVRINEKVHGLVRINHLFGPFIFNPIEKHGCTVDDLLVTLKPKTGCYIPPNLPDSDIKERFELWEECLLIDTCLSIATGDPFEMNECEYPTHFRNHALYFTRIKADFSIPFQSEPMTVPCLARNSIWHGTDLASLFDEAREMTCIAAAHYSSNLLMFRLSLIRNVRRAMRFSRENAIGAVHCFPSDTVSSIHSDLVQQYEETSLIFKPFQSLALFGPGHPTVDFPINQMWRSFVSLNQELLLLFSSFAYLHFPVVTSAERIYSISRYSQSQYTSMEILLTILKVAAFVVKAMYRSSSLVLSKHENIPSLLNGNIPSPGLASVNAAISLYIISSSCLQGCKTFPNFMQEVVEIISQTTIPAIKKISFIKPVVHQYYLKLESMLISLA